MNFTWISVLHFVGPVGAQRAERLRSAAEAEAGPGKHPYFAARGLVLDQEVEQALQTLHKRNPGSRLQVVNVGCGMDTRPWRLHFPPDVSWTDVDTPEIIDLKRKLLIEQEVDMGGKQAEQPEQSRPSRFLLRASRYSLLGHTVSSEAGSFKEALQQTAHDPKLPTLWIMEGLLYYLGVAACEALFKDASELCPCCSWVIASMVTKECMHAIQRAATEGLCNPSFYFHSNYEDLLGTDGKGGSGSLADGLGWSLQRLTPDISHCLQEGSAMCYPAYPAALMKAPYVHQLRDVERIALLMRK
ncbi:S-adenosyl-L-methionine-dependent methyltransferase [Dunaliella salina]|uniref:S-adenosyl-L-methionine-dependent methyltransferase n=1 Tax=Dunaliella salina TaxID=3046 RepID=A0ABQ7G0K3_DUNSA|nr:S-adenosyl-L-methionine-dependent methyltransferase [Dunaliella salina]|eukprot:KAF5828130.1 S-adenosyl-L-methionine-dependent methyltransferase [Dunaliella salina]